MPKQTPLDSIDADCDRIVKVFQDHGWRITRYQAKDLWSEISDDRCAGWLVLPDDDDDLWERCEGFRDRLILPLQLAAATADAKRYRKYLSELTTAVRAYLDRMERVMKVLSTFERGQEIARMNNALEFANDSARHLGLGIDLKTGKVQREKKPVKSN